MKAIYFTAVVAAIAVTHVNARANGILEEHPIDWYDCSGKPDGNYEHPTDCTRFISCSGGIASQRDCANCNVDPVRCPEGRTVYNSTVDACLWADETQCRSSGVETTTTTTERPAPTSEETPSTPRETERTTTTEGNPGTTAANNSTEEPPNPTTSKPRPPQPGDSCDPELCKNIGYCQSYLRCDKNTSQLVEEQCGENLVWNPLHPNGTEHIHGGNCDIWDNLDESIEREYRKDPECLACFWREIGECESEYLYQPPDQKHRNVMTLTCAEGLVFSGEKETCQLCSDVIRRNGTACCAA